MDGLEKITGRIREDADREAAAIAERTRAEIADIRAKAQAQADRERDDILERGRRAAGERLESAPKIEKAT